MNAFVPRSASHDAAGLGITYHGEALARIPFLERAGGWIVLSFTVAFAGFLLLMNLVGQVPGQSFPLKSISDGLQFVGEVIGLAFTLAVALRLRKASVLSLQNLRQKEVRSGQMNSERGAAWTEAQNARRSSWAWILLSIAIAVYASGQAVWTSYDVRMPSATVPFPGIYDIGFVASYPFFVIGALLLTRRGNRGATVGRIRALLDALLVIGAALSLSWFFIFIPSIAGLAQQPSVGAAFLAIYFPGSDLLLVALGAFLMFSQFSTREQQAVFMRLCLGLFFLAVTDSILVWLSLSFAFNTGTIQDILWPLSMQMVGLAALAFPRSVAQEQERTARAASMADALGSHLRSSKLSAMSLTLQTAAPFILALGASAVLLTILPETARDQRFAASLIALLLFVLVAIRQALTLNENNRLRLQLAGELVLSRRELQVTRHEADAATQEAQEKQQLEQGVIALQMVHARIASGDFSVRASADSGPLQAVAVSVNLMIERLKHLALRANRYEQLIDESKELQQALEQLSRGTAAWEGQTNLMSKTELRSLYFGIERLQHFQVSQWKSFLTTLERTVLPLGRLQVAWRSSRQSGEMQALESTVFRSSESTIQHVEQQLQKLIEQMRTVIERLEGNTTPQPFTRTPQPHPFQSSLDPRVQASERSTSASQPLQPRSTLGGEGSPQGIPGHFPRKTLFPKREDERFS
ncbi:MAG: hypothetical protein ABI234_07020 [Ktedonobacteraceae bacterium]